MWREYGSAFTWKKDRGSLEVALLVEDAQVELHVRPVGRKRVDDPRQVLGERHETSA